MNQVLGQDAGQGVGQGGGSERLRLEDALNQTCPWSGQPISADALTLYGGAVVGFFDAAARDQFVKAIRHFENALANRRADSSVHGRFE